MAQDNDDGDDGNDANMWRADGIWLRALPLEAGC